MINLNLKEMDKAPEFTGINQFGKKISLKEFRKKKVILYFYPKDNTPGCTAEACNFKDHYKQLKNQGYEVLGVSTDNEKSHLKFIEKYDLPFMLIADTDKKIVNAYGVWGEKKFMGRSYLGTNRVTFVIDENGLISKIISAVKTKDHVRQILNNF